MRKLTLFILVLVGSTLTNAQNNAQKIRLVEIPSKIALVTVAYQQNCPLRIEEPRLLFNLASKDFLLTYRVRNISKIGIKSFGLSKWNIGGGGGDLSNIELGSKELLPGQTSEINKLRNEQILPFDNELRTLLGLKDEMTTVLVIFVKEVRFSNNSRFENEATLDNFVDFLNRTSVGRTN